MGNSRGSSRAVDRSRRFCILMFSFWSEPSSARITRPVSLPDRTLSTVPLSPLSSGAALSSAAPGGRGGEARAAQEM